MEPSIVFSEALFIHGIFKRHLQFLHGPGFIPRRHDLLVQLLPVGFSQEVHALEEVVDPPEDQLHILVSVVEQLPNHTPVQSLQELPLAEIGTVQRVVVEHIPDDVVLQEGRILILKGLVPHAYAVHQQQVLHIPQSVLQVIPPDEDGQGQVVLPYHRHGRTAVPPRVVLHMLLYLVVQAAIHRVQIHAALT